MIVRLLVHEGAEFSDSHSSRITAKNSASKLHYFLMGDIRVTSRSANSAIPFTNSSFAVPVPIDIIAILLRAPVSSPRSSRRRPWEPLFVQQVSYHSDLVLHVVKHRFVFADRASKFMELHLLLPVMHAHPTNFLVKQLYFWISCWPFSRCLGAYVEGIHPELWSCAERG